MGRALFAAGLSNGSPIRAKIASGDFLRLQSPIRASPDAKIAPAQTVPSDNILL
jgi:hypothetical protein